MQHEVLQYFSKRFASMFGAHSDLMVPTLKSGSCAGPYADEFRRYASRVPIVTFAMNDREADIHVQDVKYGLYETEMRLSTPVGIAEIITGLLGRHNVQNILAAVACGLALNLGLPVSFLSLSA